MAAGTRWIRSALRVAGNLQSDGEVRGTGLYDGTDRVYSAGNPPPSSGGTGGHDGQFHYRHNTAYGNAASGATGTPWYVANQITAGSLPTGRTNNLAGYLYAVPFYASHAGVVTELAVNTASTTNEIKFGIYNTTSEGNLIPSSLAATATRTMSGSGKQAVAINFTPTASTLYWIAVVTNAATGWQLVPGAVAWPILGIGQSAAFDVVTPFVAWVNVGGYPATMPTTFPNDANLYAIDTSGNVPAIYVRQNAPA